jgi:hypothetical protein
MEQDHRFVKHHVHPVLGLGVFDTVQQPIQGYDAIYMFHKGQVEGTGKENAGAQSLLLTSCSGWQHKEPLSCLALCSNSVFITPHKQLHEYVFQSVHYRLWGCMVQFLPLGQTSSLGCMGRRNRCRPEMAHGYSSPRRALESAVLMGSYSDRAQGVQG